MLFSILRSGDITTAIIQILLSVPVILFALTIHEASHAYAAYLLGDQTSRNMGRLTLNPAKHLDLVGTLCMLVFGFGWAKPVQINARNFKNPKWGMALSALAGPASNFLQGIVGSVFYAFFYELFTKLNTSPDSPVFLVYLALICVYFFMMVALYNFAFMAFNLIPVPPFDGSRFAFAFLPSKWYFGIMKYERIIMLVILIAIWILPFSPVSWIANFLLAKISYPFSLLFSLIFH